MKRDVMAGMLLVNTVPHAVMGLSGHRCRTPWGATSPRQNLAWAGVNLGAAVVVLCGGWADADQRAAEGRRLGVGAGMCAMTVFGMAFEASVGRRERQERIEHDLRRT